MIAILAVATIRAIAEQTIPATWKALTWLIATTLVATWILEGLIRIFG